MTASYCCRWRDVEGGGEGGAGRGGKLLVGTIRSLGRSKVGRCCLLLLLLLLFLLTLFFKMFPKRVSEHVRSADYSDNGGEGVVDVLWLCWMRCVWLVRRERLT